MGIFDRLMSRPQVVSKAQASSIIPVSSFSEGGFSGLKHFSGRLDEEFDRELRGTQGRKKLRQMRDNDSTYGGVLAAISMLMRQVEWIAEPCEDEEVSGEVRLADGIFLEGAIEDMEHTWAEFMSEAVGFLPFGFSLFEEVYKLRAGRERTPSSAFQDFAVGWLKLAGRAQESIEEWVIGPHGEILGAQQRDPSSGKVVVLPMSKLLLLRTTAEKNNPEGRSIGRNGYRDYRLKTGIEEIEAIGIERDAAGMPVVRMPPDRMVSGDSLYQSLKKLVRNIRRDDQEGVVFPLAYDENGNETYKLELLSSAGSRQIDINGAVQRHNTGIAVSCLADFILLGHQQVGSLALSSDKTALFSVAIGCYLDMIGEAFNRVAIPRLWAMNGWNRPTPWLRHEDIETADLGVLGTFVQALTGAGIDLTDAATEAELRRVASLPPPVEAPALMASKSQRQGQGRLKSFVRTVAGLLEKRAA